MSRFPRPLLLFVSIAAVALSACELATTFDRSLIPSSDPAATDGSIGALADGASSLVDGAAAADGGPPTDGSDSACTGGFDPTFGDGGILYLDDAGAATSVVYQPDGKIVVAGGSGDRGLVLVRLTSNGALDPSFGSGGMAIAAGDPAIDMARASDGRLVVLTQHALSRYTVGGAVDLTFGSGGTVTTSFTALHVALGSDGRIMVLGKTNAGFVLAAFGVDGAQDLSFGNAGAAQLQNGDCAGWQGALAGAAFAALDGGGCVIADLLACPDGPVPELHRFARDGTQTAYVRRSPFGQNSVALDNAGRAVLAGSYELSRVDPTTLVPDNTYDQNANLNNNDAGVAGLGLAFDTQGRTFYLGDVLHDPSGPPPQAALFRLQDDGTLDTSFGAAGVLLFPNADLASSYVPPSKIVLQGCNLAVVGLVWSTFAIARVQTCCPEK